jgi:SAM-dependent methyltransferase
MAHPEQAVFLAGIKRKFPDKFRRVAVLDIGSLDINGNNRDLFQDCLYIGIDVGYGKNVDFEVKGHELQLPDGSFDVVISSECFEHDQYYEKTLRNAVRLLRPGGLFLFTCATTGRPEHGTRRTSPEAAPLLEAHAEWADYYKNLTTEDICAVIDVQRTFSSFSFQTDDSACDLYFWGIKVGVKATAEFGSFHTEAEQNQAMRAVNAEMQNRINALELQLEAKDQTIFQLAAFRAELVAECNRLANDLGARERRIQRLQSTWHQKAAVSVYRATKGVQTSVKKKLGGREK